MPLMPGRDVTCQGDGNCIFRKFQFDDLILCHIVGCLGSLAVTKVIERKKAVERTDRQQQTQVYSREAQTFFGRRGF